MKFHLYKVSGYEEAIMSLRMSKGKFSWESALAVQDLVYVCTNRHGFLSDFHEYRCKLDELYLLDDGVQHPKITGDYWRDISEFKRLLNLVMDEAMGHHDHHTLMKYIDVSFFTDGLHRGAQDDLDSHAISFNNRITRFSTRLAVIDDVKVSEWYEDKVIPFHMAHKLIRSISLEKLKEMGLRDWMTPDIEHLFAEGTNLPAEIEHNGNIFKYTPFGYVLDKYVDMNPEALIRKDVIRGLIPLGTPGPALWKTDLWSLRYIYYRRGKLTKANPELKMGIEMLADQIEAKVPVFGDKFRYEYTDSGKWEDIHKVKTITLDEWKQFQDLKYHGLIK